MCLYAIVCDMCVWVVVRAVCLKQYACVLSVDHPFEVQLFCTCVRNACEVCVHSVATQSCGCVHEEDFSSGETVDMSDFVQLNKTFLLVRRSTVNMSMQSRPCCRRIYEPRRLVLFYRD